jgi:hypothetical protein
VRTAVLKIEIDREGILSADHYQRGLERLSAAGLKVIASPLALLPKYDREIEVILLDPFPGQTGEVVNACASAFGTPAEAGAITYTSRGTDEDVVGVLAAFALKGELHREEADGFDVVTVILSRSDSQRVPESSLHTALEAALNCEVRIRYSNN